MHPTRKFKLATEVNRVTGTEEEPCPTIFQLDVLASEDQGVRDTGRTEQLDRAMVDLGPRGDYVRFLAAADIFALPSRLKGLPIGMLEAMAIGLPGIASRVGGIPEVITAGREGFLVVAGDVAALASTIEQLTLDPELSRRMSVAAAARAEVFTAARLVGAYMGADRALASPRKLPPERRGH